jgi:hypothetical protein
MMAGLAELIRAAAELQKFFATQNWRFCFIGGVALQRWGNPRFTQDIDLTLLTGFGNEEAFIDTALAHLQPRRADAATFALKSRVLLAQTASGIAVDIALGALPFEERSISRSSNWNPSSDIILRTCSADDLVIHKVFAGRARDWDDVESVMARQRLNLNWTLIRSELQPLLEVKEDVAALDQLRALSEKVKRRLDLQL